MNDKSFFGERFLLKNAIKSITKANCELHKANVCLEMISRKTNDQEKSDQILSLINRNKVIAAEIKNRIAETMILSWNTESES